MLFANGSRRPHSVARVGEHPDQPTKRISHQDDNALQGGQLRQAGHGSETVLTQGNSGEVQR